MTVSLQDWLANAEHHYLRACECFTEAKKHTPRGDPQTFDEWMRMATWHVQAVGATVGLARATSDHAAR